MNYIYAMLLCGIICVITQLFAETKVNFGVVAIFMISVFGGLFTKLGIIDWACGLGAGGVNVTALGCGNGAYGSGAMLGLGMGAKVLILAAAVNALVVLMGTIAGVLFEKLHSE